MVMAVEMFGGTFSKMKLGVIICSLILGKFVVHHEEGKIFSV